MPETEGTRQPVDRLLAYSVRFGLLAGFLGIITALNRVSPDLFHEMALFREALATGRIPSQDVFAYTPTLSPCIHHEWGTGAVCYGLATSLGGPGIVLLKYLGALVIGIGSFALARRRGASEPVFAVLAPVAILCSCIGFFSVRAQLFSLFFLLLLLFLLEHDREGKKSWVLLWLPLYVVWLNMHAGFLAGVGLFVTYGFGRFATATYREKSVPAGLYDVRHLIGTAVAMAILSGVNPFGWAYLRYLWRAVLLDRPFVGEWQPVWHHPLILLFYAFSLLPVLYVAWRRLASTWPDLLLIVVPAVLAFQHVRHLSIYALVWICYLPSLLDTTELGQLVRGLWRTRPVVVASLWCALGMIGLTQAIRGHFWELRIPTSRSSDAAIHYPAGAVDYMAKNGFTGNVMVPFEVGAFVSWYLYPAVKISCDGRYEVAYPADQVAEIVALYRTQENWRRTLLRYPSDAVLVPRGSALEPLLQQDASSTDALDLKLVYRDDGYSLYVRTARMLGLRPQDRSGEPILARFP